MQEKRRYTVDTWGPDCYLIVDRQTDRLFVIFLAIVSNTFANVQVILAEVSSNPSSDNYFEFAQEIMSIPMFVVSPGLQGASVMRDFLSQVLAGDIDPSNPASVPAQYGGTLHGLPITPLHPTTCH